MNYFSGYRVKQRKGVSHWESLLEEWILLLERYARIMEGEDAPYLFNERANIGVLAGAAWRTGSIALEEYQSDKGHKNQPKKQGRVDLWLTNDGKTEDIVEAKFKYVSMGATNDISKIVSPVMEKANMDAWLSIRGIIEFNAIGVGFFPLYISKSKISENNTIDSYIEKSLEIFKTLPYDGIAWSFPLRAREYIGERENYIPGLVMLIQNNKANPKKR